MKKIVLIATVAALAIPFAAQAEGSYLGLNVGSAKQKYSVTGSSGSASDTGVKVYGGTSFDKNFGVEAGYVDLGNAKKTFNGVDVSAKSNAFYVAATATAPINDQFAVFAKLGVTANRTKITSTSAGVNSKFNNTDAIFGVGASYAISKELSAVAEYENFGKLAKGSGANLKADMFSVGLRYNF